MTLSAALSGTFETHAVSFEHHCILLGFQILLRSKATCPGVHADAAAQPSTAVMSVRANNMKHVLHLCALSSCCLLVQATYYGKGGDKQGACGYGASKANSMDLPWSTGMTMTVAINDFQFASSLSCGMCVKFRGVGTGIGTQPLPQQWQYAVVTNR